MYCMKTSDTVIFLEHVLYENIDQILPNELHGPIHYTIVDAVTCVYNGHVLYTLLL